MDNSEEPLLRFGSGSFLFRFGNTRQNDHCIGLFFRSGLFCSSGEWVAKQTTLKIRKKHVAFVAIVCSSCLLTEPLQWYFPVFFCSAAMGFGAGFISRWYTLGILPGDYIYRAVNCKWHLLSCFRTQRTTNAPKSQLLKTMSRNVTDDKASRTHLERKIRPLFNILINCTLICKIMNRINVDVADRWLMITFGAWWITRGIYAWTFN